MQTWPHVFCNVKTAFIFIYEGFFFIEAQAVIKITSNFDRSGLHQLRLEQTVCQWDHCALWR